MSSVTQRHRRQRRHRDPQIVHWLERVEGRFMGTPIDIDPHEALLHAIRVTAGEVVYCDQQIARLEEDELFERPTRTTYEMASGSLAWVEEKRDAEILSRWVTLRDLAVDRMARYSKMALDAGVAERQVVAAERVATILEPLLRNLATDLELSPKQQRRLPQVISESLKSLERGAVNGSA